MSMISSLIDELNNSADEWNSSNMFELARMCRDAADTITELRGALQVASVDYRHLSEENAKLRELLAGAFEDMVAWQRVIACSNEWGYGRGCREQLFELRDAMRDLGVEVDFDGR